MHYNTLVEDSSFNGTLLLGMSEQLISVPEYWWVKATRVNLSILCITIKPKLIFQAESYSIQFRTVPTIVSEIHWNMILLKTLFSPTMAFGVHSPDFVG